MSRTGTIGWKCKQCGNINGLEAKFCRGCGAPASFGTPVDTSKRHTQSHPTQRSESMTGTGSSMDNRTPRNIEKNQSGGNVNLILIGIIIVLVLLLLAFGIYMIIHAKNSDKNARLSESELNQSEMPVDNSENDNQTSQQEIATSNETQESEEKQDSEYVVGQEYTVQPSDGLKVRNEPSTRSDKSILKREQLPSEYQSSLEEGPYAVLKQGTKVTCKNIDGNWMLIADGCWVCVKYKGEVLVK